MIPPNLQELAQEKDHEDSRDEWIDCPECKTDDAVIISKNYQTYAVCPDCEDWEWIDGE